MTQRISAFIGILLLIAILSALVVALHRHRENTNRLGDEAEVALLLPREVDE